MQTIHWTVDIQTITPSAALPQPVRLEVSSQDHPDYHIKGINRPNDNFAIWVHTLEGQGCFADAEATYTVPAGHSFLCQVNDPHIQYYFPPRANEPWKLMWLGIQGKAGLTMVHDLIDRYGPIFNLAENHPVLNSLMQYQTYHGLTLELSPFTSAALVHNLLCALGEQAFEKQQLPSHSIVIQKTRRFISQNLHRRITIHDIAAHLHLSREHLSRCFQKQTGITLRHYINQQKIRLACKLIKQTHLSNKEIAVRLGFEQASQFTRVFKKQTRLTPTAFRENPAVTPLW